jgi:poly(glycerol-phosphate) alpha-glucosyltransferase
VLDPDGAVFMRSATRPDGTTAASRTFYRSDGSEFLRDESPTDAGGRSLGRYLTLLDRDGNAVGRWRSAAGFYRHWLKELAGSEPATFVVDSAYATSIVAPLQQENIIKLVVMHNSHVAAGRDPFQGKVGEGRKSVVEDTGAWDGIVFLTRQNQQDFEDRFGKSTNLFTVPNPSARSPQLPDFAARGKHRGVMVCRLEPQKNVAQAIRIMALVHASLPTCVLDIYGSGSQREELQAMAGELGLSDVVRFRGHAANAAAAFETARFSLLTSRNEGQGLVLMESMGRGCPPVSYDIRYGPGELIDDGETGFLVRPGDAAAAAERIIRLCTDDELARSLGRTGWERSSRFSDEAIIGQWGRTLEQIWRQQPGRLVLSDLGFELQELGMAESGGLEVLGELTWRQEAGPAAQDVLGANLVIGRRSSGRPLFLPAAVLRREPGRLAVHGKVSPKELAEDVPEDNNELDLYLQVEGANVLRTFRLGFPGPAPQWRPYATVHGSLSLKFA